LTELISAKELNSEKNYRAAFTADYCRRTPLQSTDETARLPIKGDSCHAKRDKWSDDPQRRDPAREHFPSHLTEQD
jgi:hypothetical protein